MLTILQSLPEAASARVAAVDEGQAVELHTSSEDSSWQALASMTSIGNAANVHVFVHVFARMSHLT